MGRKLGLFHILLFIVFALSTASAENIVYLDPLEVNLPDCGTATVAVRLNSTDAIGGFQSDIKFDPDVVRITDIAFVGGYNCSFSFMINNTNYYRLVGINNNGDVAGEQTLAVFTIECINCDAYYETRIDFDDEDMELILVNQTGYKFPAIWENTTIKCGTTLDTTVSIEDVTIAPGESINVPIMINNTENLGGCIINFEYDPAIVHVSDVVQGDINLLACNINNSCGLMQVNAIETSGLNGNIVFANVNLTAVGSRGNISMLNITVDQLFDMFFIPITYTIIDGIFTIEEDTESPEVLNAYASRIEMLNDNGRPRKTGTNITVLNITAIDEDSGIRDVTINLSTIGGSPVRTMKRILGTDIWTVSTNAVSGINLTHNLNINVTDNKGNYNNSIGITLTVLRRGDIYRDNNLDYKDVLYIARYLASLPPECNNPPSVLVGDVVGVSGEAKGDGIVDLLDALYIARYDAGMEGEP
jgi:hypothetical protein